MKKLSLMLLSGLLLLAGCTASFGSTDVAETADLEIEADQRFVTVPADKEEQMIFTGQWMSDDEETVIPITVHLYTDGTLIAESHEMLAGYWSENEDNTILLQIGENSYTAKYSMNTYFFRYRGTLGEEEFEVQLTVPEDPEKVAERNNQVIISAFKGTVKDLVNEYEGHEGEVIFYGGSNFVKWENLAEDMAPYPVQNKSFGGSNDATRSAYLQELIYDAKPKILVTFNDTNNWTSGQTMEMITSFREKMLDEIHEKLPDCVVLFLSSTPNPLRYFGEYHSVSVESDEWTKAYCDSHEGFEYLDVVMPLTDNGQPVDVYWQADHLHLTEEGYAVLAPVVKAKLDELSIKYGLSFGG